MNKLSERPSDKQQEENEHFVINTPIGHMAIKICANELHHIDLNSERSLKSPGSDFAKDVSRQIDCYFKDPSFKFHIKMKAEGTDYQKSIWKALTEIPVGEIMTYGALASKVDSGARAIGNACRNNPIPLIVPCHRIVSASGLGGFAGKLDGRLIDIKQTLLVHEKAMLI